MRMVKHKLGQSEIIWNRERRLRDAEHCHGEPEYLRVQPVREEGEGLAQDAVQAAVPLLCVRKHGILENASHDRKRSENRWIE
jgi:hypothetical protein